MLRRWIAGGCKKHLPFTPRCVDCFSWFLKTCSLQLLSVEVGWDSDEHRLGSQRDLRMFPTSFRQKIGLLADWMS